MPIIKKRLFLNFLIGEYRLVPIARPAKFTKKPMLWRNKLDINREKKTNGYRQVSEGLCKAYKNQGAE
jgi:hypothetical protein